MEDTICLDTDVLADFLRNKPNTIKWFEDNQEKNLATTLINVFELYYGAYRSKEPEKSKNKLSQVIERLHIFNLSMESIEEAAKQKTELEKEGNVIDIKDLLLGAIALTEGCPIKTNNKEHFSRIKKLELAQ